MQMQEIVAGDSSNTIFSISLTTLVCATEHSPAQSRSPLVEGTPKQMMQSSIHDGDRGLDEERPCNVCFRFEFLDRCFAWFVDRFVLASHAVCLAFSLLFVEFLVLLRILPQYAAVSWQKQKTRWFFVTVATSACTRCALLLFLPIY
jgi:hypothetical protein